MLSIQIRTMGMEAMSKRENLEAQISSYGICQERKIATIENHTVYLPKIYEMLCIDLLNYLINTIIM